MARSNVISSHFFTEANLKETNSHRVFLIAHPTAKVINPSFLKGTCWGLGKGPQPPHIVLGYTHTRQGMSARPSIYHLSKIR